MSCRPACPIHCWGKPSFTIPADREEIEGEHCLVAQEVLKLVLKLREEPKLKHIKVRNASHCFFQEKEW
jgi:hypothetical protein